MIPTAPDDAGIGAAWRLTRAVSPRSRVRVAVGDQVNAYPVQAPVTGPAPEGPWAMYLADARGRFWFIGLDLDAHGGGAVEAKRDAETIATELERAGVAHVVCASGPSGGRHVWVGLAEPADAGLVRHLAHSLKRIAPSLDVTPLLNPATGCLRPPGAPHRSGGVSRVIAGDLTALTRPSTTPGQLVELASRLNDQAHEPMPAEDRPSGTDRLPVDEEGRPWLPGPRRPLPAKSRAALDTPLDPGADASRALYIVCLGAAAAHWHWRDLAALVATAPGMEHARTQRAGHDHTRRRPRPPYGQHGPEAVLGRVWQAACQWVATHERRAGDDDPTFDVRAEAIAALVDQVQSRADTAPGRWARGGGPADRRVLDTLCLWALQAVRPDIEADTRRLALTASIGRETARTALQRLAADGWITQTIAAAGRHGPTWTIDPHATIHRSASSTWAQGAARPAKAGATWRQLLADRLTQRLQLAAHDVFTGHLQRIADGNLYARLDEPEVVATTSWHDIERLVEGGLVTRVAGGWRRRGRRALDRVAWNLGVEGVLDARRRRYVFERQLWDWWCSEHEWMIAPGRHKRRRQPLTQAAFAFGRPWDRWPPYPRSGRRADHRQAAALLSTGTLKELEHAA